MTEQLKRDLVEQFIDMEEDEFYIEKLRSKHNIAPDSSVFHTTISRLVEEKRLKRVGRGLYRKLKEVKPVNWLDANEDDFFDLAFPKGHKDDTYFGFEDLFSVSEGDLIVITGVSNYGKSTIVHNMLAENCDKYECILMGSECVSLNGMPSAKFKRRMMSMKWMDWVNGDGKSKFDLLPVRDNYEDYVQEDKINFIDWINMTDNFFCIGKIFEDCKGSVGKGLVVAVLQKEEDAPLGRGKGFTRDLADVYIKIDPFGISESRLTLDKIKAPKKRGAFGKMWAFGIVDNGANLVDIREIEKCRVCWGKKWKKVGNLSVPCDECHQTGYVNVFDI